MKILCMAKKKSHHSKDKYLLAKKIFATYHKRIISLTYKDSSKYIKIPSSSE